MIDFPFEEPCLLSALFSLFLYAINIFNNYEFGIKKTFKVKITSLKQNLVLIFLFFSFSCLCIDGDFFHFQVVVKCYSFVLGAYNYGEPIYGVITAFVNSNYLLFRFVVWGGSFILFCITAKRFEIPVYNAAVLLFAMYPITFTYARVTCALSIYFLGASFFCIPYRNKYIGYFLGALLIYYSNLFHTSVVLMAILTVSAFCPINKKTFILFLLLMPLVIYFMQDSFTALADGADEMENTDRAKRIGRYSENANTGLKLSFSTPGVFFHRILSYISFYVPIVIFIKIFLDKKKSFEIPMSLHRLFRILFGTFIVSSIFYFLPYGGAVLIYRILFMTMIPIVLILCKLKYLNLISDSYYSLITKCGMTYSIVRILYYLYSYHN